MYWHGGFKDADNELVGNSGPRRHRLDRILLNISSNAITKSAACKNHFSLAVDKNPITAGAPPHPRPEITTSPKSAATANGPSTSTIQT